ncbi:hypothetical protein Leryth_007076 [Lithospermum erythrorhizon]|nr:hypothetical protein Leryth_007076 [Lithospermum erythrorhizon]
MDKGKQIEEKEEAIELILFQVSECYVYMIPPRKSAASYRLMGHKGTLILISKEDQETLVKRFSSQRSLLVGEGHQRGYCLGIDVRYSLVRFEVEGPNPTTRADEWNVNKWAWEGALKFGLMWISKIGELYARAFLREGEPHPVEPVIDSSRYFVLRVEENIDGRERHAFIGLGFRERPQSYDFEAALHDHMKYLNKKKTAEEMEQKYQKSSSDYSLKEGQTLVLQLKNKPSGGVKSKFFEQGLNNLSLEEKSNKEPKISIIPPPPPPNPLSPAVSPRESPSEPPNKISLNETSPNRSSDTTEGQSQESKSAGTPSPHDAPDDDFGDFQAA